MFEGGGMDCEEREGIVKGRNVIEGWKGNLRLRDWTGDRRDIDER